MASPEEIAAKLHAERVVKIGRIDGIDGPLAMLGAVRLTRLCGRDDCSHLFAEHTGPDGECDCCRCESFIDEPDWVPSGSSTRASS